MDLFDHDRVARGYAEFRPRFHSQVLDRIRDVPGFPRAIPRGLDVGCGTGLSSVPLTALARTVVGVDRARGMVAVAEPGEGVQYLVSAAEELPFIPGAFGAISVCGAINWIDRSRFLPEAHRLLSPSGWLLVYDGAEMGAMVGRDDFRGWYTQEYQRRLPRPRRDERPIGDSEASAGGFVVVHRDEYVLQLPFALPAYVGFLLTQSNVTAALAQRFAPVLLRVQGATDALQWVPVVPAEHHLDLGNGRTRR